MKPGTLRRPWGSLRYRRIGNGVPLVLLHPLALSGRLYEPVVEDFLPGHDVVVPDLRGHGDSDWDGEAFTIDDLADDVAALLEDLGSERSSILGMSMGGCVAMTVGVRHPRRVRNLLLCDTTAWYGADAETKWQERAGTAESKTRDEQLPFQIDRWFNAGFREAHPDIVKHACDVFRNTKPLVHAQACRALGQFDLRDHLASIEAHTLVATGEEDYATPPAMGEALARGIPGARFVLWPGVRHMAVMESASLRKELREFAGG